MDHIEIDKTKQILSYAQATLQVPVNHRLVLLDFIPVKERLPEEEGHYYCIDNDGLITCGDAVYFEYTPETPPGVWVTRFGDRVFPTHYAEVPEIE